MTQDEMKKYMPAVTPGAARIRVRNATLDNTFGRNPSIVWQREKQIMLDDGTYEYVPMLPIYTEVTPELLRSQIDLIDVDSGTDLGEILGAAIVVALGSLFVSEDIKQSKVTIDTTIPVPPLPEDGPEEPIPPAQDGT